MPPEADLIDARVDHSLNKKYMGGEAFRLTWDGQEFLSKIQSDTAWSKVKKVVADKGISLGFDAIKAAATYYLKSQFPG